MRSKSDERHAHFLYYDAVQRHAEQRGRYDRYQRRVGIVRIAPPDCVSCAPSIDVGLALISAGLAWHYRSYEREQNTADRDYYRSAEAGARARQDGLWADAAPTPPWDWRRARREGSAARH